MTSGTLGDRSDGLPPERRRLAYATIAITTTMAILDGTIANVALPSMARDLHASPTAAIWIVNSFLLAVVATIFPFAALAERRGQTLIYRIGIGAFLAGSLLCACSRSLPILIAARAFQGLGAAATLSISPSLLRAIFARDELGRALGINALVIAAASAAGPTVGGLILGVAPWPWLFAINVPLGLVTLALSRALPADRPRGGSLDLASVVTAICGPSVTVWGLDGFARHDPAWTIAARLVVGLAMSAAFVRRQFTMPEPMIALDLFRIPPFAMAGATSFTTFVAQGTAFIALPFLYQTALGRSPLESGLLLTSWPLAIALVAPIAGRLSDRFPVGILSTTGLVVFAGGLALLAAMPAHPTSLDMVLRGIVCGLGFGFFQSPNNRELIGSAPRSKSPSAGAILATLRQTGQSVGAAAAAIVFGATAAQSVAHAAPIALWVACACAALATLASALRLAPALRTSSASTDA
jgi:DHA2 family multidrug resistance protein-like MFS transporter